MHVAIIMDGNGRWAERRGLRRTAGHTAGAAAVRRIVEAAARSPVDVLTLYAFSSDNWSRPADEVAGLMLLLREYLRTESAQCLRNGVRVNVIGRRDRLNRHIVRAIERTERLTGGCRNLTLQLAIDYSARDAIVRAADGYPLDSSISRQPYPRPGDQLYRQFADRLARVTHSILPDPRVDLLIRTGGELRLSDFLLWESAYAELLFTEVCWPDFDESAFEAALQEFRLRKRRFGALEVSPAAALSGANR